MKNPFNITKAVDYSDEELNSFWVDFPQGGFKASIKPTSEMPMIILGSKGSGKTHIMKHFSFTMQSIRHSSNLLEGVLKDGYIGTYLRCSGLNAYKFNGRGENEDVWESFFAYYLELWLGQLIINNIKILIDKSKIEIELKLIILEIKSLFDIDDLNVKLDDLDDLSNLLHELQKDIDFAINNRALTKEKISEKVKILVSPGKLIFGIPEIFSKNISEFKHIKFLYLLDEYENFTENQQKYFNTLIRERKNPTCFKIGSRRYGIRTKQTLNAQEEIKIGSEYELLDIDDIFRKNPKEYKSFIEQICQKRLASVGFDIDTNDIKTYFETFSEKKLFEQVKKRKKGHLAKIGNNLEKYGKATIKHAVIENLKFNKDLILERANVFLLYRAWKNNKDLLKESLKIKEDCLIYYKNPVRNSSHGKILDKYKNDIIDYLYRENNIQSQSKIGFNNIIRISNGIPRHFLIIMKHIYRWSEFYGNEIFQSSDEKINARCQINSISDAAVWFLEDSKVPGKDGNKMKSSIERLCDYLRELRFSDLPPECSISSFSISTNFINSDIKEIIDFLEQYSYVIKTEKGRRDKNLNSRNETFQINGLLAVEWELSLARRGIVNLSDIEMKGIFYPNNEMEYNTLRGKSLTKYNAPFSSENNSLDLFSQI